MKIYTRTGDDGTTGILGGARVPKTSAVIRAIGDVDELNACIGVARATSPESSLDPLLQSVQHWLFDVGSQLAAPGDGRWELFSHGKESIHRLESSIDAQVDALPPLQNFILPGGTALAAGLHHARTVSRRAERSVLDLDFQSTDISTFLNRLSDWLFVAARSANAQAGMADVTWRKPEDH